MSLFAKHAAVFFYVLHVFIKYACILDLRATAVSAFVASSAYHRAFWYPLPTHRLYSTGKAVLFVIGNDFFTLRPRVLKLREQ